MSDKEAPFGYTKAGEPRKRPARKSEGRETKFKPEYCEQLIEHMSTGLSFESFAGECDVPLTTLWRWEAANPKFREAKQIGMSKGLVFWEKIGRNASAGKIPRFSAPAWIFNMKNRYQWRDKHEIEVKGIKPAVVEKLNGDTVELLAEKAEIIDDRDAATKKR